VALAARAQQSKMPVIGVLSSGLPDKFVAAFRSGVNEVGYFERKNVRIEYRPAEGKYDRLPALATDLVDRQVNVIAALGGPSPAQAAKFATSTIPIVFQMGADPVALGIVASLNRPGGNVTGVTRLSTELTAKRIELLHELLPTTAMIALLVNPDNPTSKSMVIESESAAHSLGLQLIVLSATAESDFEVAFTTLTRRGAGALIVRNDPFFTSRDSQLVALAARYAIPAIYDDRQHPVIGGLVSYGARGHHVGNPARRRHRARLRGAQRPCRGTICRYRPAGEYSPRSHPYLGASRAIADHAHLAGAGRSGRSDVLWSKLPGPVPPRRRLC
jgi:putative ABC transport system substrate-binding protein